MIDAQYAEQRKIGSRLTILYQNMEMLHIEMDQMYDQDERDKQQQKILYLQTQITSKQQEEQIIMEKVNNLIVDRDRKEQEAAAQKEAAEMQVKRKEAEATLITANKNLKEY